MAQGWPENYGGVMLQGFYWDYYDDAGWGTWEALEGQASDLEGYIDLIWVPNSARTKNDYCVEHAATEGSGWLKDMGYMPCWWLNHDNTIFGDTDDLKSMIATYKSKGIGIIEDVVINHKNGQNDWCDFPDEYVTGESGTYTLNWSLADICNNDNGGYVRTMFDVTGAGDTGDDFDGCRDLDHTGANVQQNVKTYLDYLQKELGYAGFRYDMVKGYGPQYVGIYNAYAKPTFSVGEFWDNWDGTTWWVNGTKQNGVIQSAAFDFPLKFLINNAFTGGFNQSALNTQGMAGSSEYQRYSVTFVDNHDTYRDGSCMSNEHHVLAANAFILSMPGTPCIFLPHWKTHKAALKRMIAARKAAGITNQSSFDSYECNNGSGRSFVVHGNNNNSILLLLGNCGDYDTSGYTSVWNADNNNWNFAMYVSNSVAGSLDSSPSGSNANLGTARVDMASGTYYQNVTVNVSPSDAFTTLVYTEDGSDPSTSSSTIGSDGKTFTYNATGSHTLKIGVKEANSIRDIKTYRYVVTDVEPTNITIYVRADKSPIYLYAWDDNGTLTADWPGTQLSAMKSANGQNFYYMTFPKPSQDYTLNYILNQGSDDTKTANNNGVGSDIFAALGAAGEVAIDLTTIYTGTSIEAPIPYKDITVYVEANRYPIKLYAWNGGGDLLGGFPGKQITHTVCIKGKNWFYETIKIQENQSPFSLVVSDGTKQSADFTGVIDDVFVSYNGKDHSALANKTSDYAGYPLAWYEEGEMCAFFTNDNNWGDIFAWVWSDSSSYYNYSNDNTNDNPGWPGNACTFLGYNEYGQKLYKWTYTGDRTSYPEKIIFNDNSNQTTNCTFVNGAWYNTSNTGDNKGPVSTAVAPSTEISIAALGTPTTGTNWNGKSEKVAQKNSGEMMTKAFLLSAGTYTVQAIVRGTNGGKVTLSAEGQSDEVILTGMKDGASTVQTNGIVEKYVLGTNNGWQKAEINFTLTEAKKLTVTLSGNANASTWQVGVLKMLPGTTKTKATTGVDLANTFVDERSADDFSFFERGENPNALIKAAAGTLPTRLSYNVIVDGACAHLKLTDGNYSFNNNESFEAAVVSYDRTFVPGQRSTICLPFALTDIEAAAAGSFWQLNSYNAETMSIRFEKVEAPSANTPYIFEAASAQPFLSLSGKTVPASSLQTVTVGGISFKGVNERINLVSTENSTTYYGYSQSDGVFVKVGTTNGANINPFRAYLQTSTPLAARMSVSFDDDDILGVQDVTPAVEPLMRQPIYNMGGQRVRTPNKKGLYIIGGKKYLVK
jgi:alpha-amylase